MYCKYLKSFANFFKCHSKSFTCSFASLSRSRSVKISLSNGTLNGLFLGLYMSAKK